MDRTDLLRARLAAAGVTGIGSVTSTTGGWASIAGIVTLADGNRMFAKTMPQPQPDLFAVEADGLRVLRELGGVRTPAVRQVTPQLLILEELCPRPAGRPFWEQLGRQLAMLHTSTTSDRFGWHQDGWLGRLRQHNSWSRDGHAFFAQHRILRWLSEPLVSRALDLPDRQALEHLCDRLPELVPTHPAALTHGDLWMENILADATGAPVLIDPAVSYTWPEVDLSMLWFSPRPPESDHCFAAYEEVAGLAGWREWSPILHLREMLSVIAHGDDPEGLAADQVRKLIAPFRRVG